MLGFIILAWLDMTAEAGHYVGCYKDELKRAMPVYTQLDVQTIELCVGLCSALGISYTLWFL